MLNHLINDSKYEEIIFECVVLSKLLRSINKIHGSNEQEIDSQKSVAKAENFFTKHSKFQELKLHAQALLMKATLINDRVKDFEEGNFEEGGMAFEGLDMPILNLLRNAQNLSDISTEIKNEYYQDLVGQQVDFCQSED